LSHFLAAVLEQVMLADLISLDFAVLLIYLSIHPFINTHKAAVIIKYKNTQSTMNRKNIQKE